MLFSGGGFLGMPPGDRDPALLKCAPASAIAYIEWAARADGKAGAPGVDGLMADPEVVAFGEALKTALTKQIAEQTASGNPTAEVVGKVLPEVMFTLINRPGCVYLGYDAEAAGNADPNALIPQLATLGAGLQATLIVNAGAEADTIAGKLQQIVNEFPEELRKENLQHQTFPDLPAGVSLTLHRHENYFILGYGKGTIEAAVAGLKGKTKEGLATSERFKSMLARVELPRTAGVQWFDVKKILEVAADVAGSQAAGVTAMAATLGVDKIDSMATWTGVVDGQIRTRSFVNTGGSTQGLLVLAAGRGIKPADLEQVPADADLVVGVSLDAARVLETARTLAAVGGPASVEQFDRILKEVELNIDATFDENILQGFGNVMVFHDSPSAGGLLVTSLVGSVEVTDYNRAYTAYTGLLDFLKSNMDMESMGGQRHGQTLEQAKYLDETIWYVNTVGRNDFPFAPSFCMTKTHLHVAPHPQALKAYLRFLKAKEPSFASKLGPEIPVSAGELFCVTYADTRSLVRYAYAFAPYVGQSLLSELQASGLKLDAFSIPSAKAILPFLANSYSTAVRTRDGILLENQSPLPIPGGSTAISALPIFASLFAFRARPFGANEMPQQDLKTVRATLPAPRIAAPPAPDPANPSRLSAPVSRK
ncbi:MAG: hypothetical protein WD669_10035 [Pirellulales bacterium]